MNNTILKRTSRVRSIGDGRIAIEYLGYSYELNEQAACLLTNITSRKQDATDGDLLDAREARLLTSLSAHGLTQIRPDPQARMTGEAFYQYHRRYCRYWLQEIYDHPFWDKVTRGIATDAQVLGFAFEKYHYIEGAYEHMGIAAANATRGMMPHLARHFCEEYSHGDIYRAGLAELFDSEVVLKSQPLPSTRALINFLNEAAATNSLAYYAANEFLQMTENEDEDKDESGSVDSVSSFYQSMIDNYPYTVPLVKAFVRHTQLDQRLGHADAFLEMCKDTDYLSQREVAQIMDTTRSLVDVLKLFMDGIDVFYREFPEVPRMPSTLISE